MKNSPKRLATIKYSERLGEISPIQLQQALDVFGLGLLQGTEPITHGLFGQSLFLSSDKGEYVLRGVPHYDWQFPAEKYFVDRLHNETDITVPHPYLYDESTDIFGWPFVIMPRLKGVQTSDKIDDKNLSTEDQVGIAKARANALVKMQKLTHTHTGYFDLDSKDIKPNTMTYTDRMVENIISRLYKARDSNPQSFTEEDERYIKSIVDKGKDHIDPEFTSTFVMQDFKPGNMLLDQVDGTWEVTGIFDLMESYFGHGESDVSRMYCTYIDAKQHDLADIFKKEYFEQLGNPEGYENRFPFFVLHDRSIIWAWIQRKHPEEIKNKYSFQEFINRYL